ncbi:MAG: MarR family transcriptional regulator [Rubrobacteraceae bacterium]|uniref:MarR family winged helix-turn-helix transcriptional regulator n=1 Tax=Rubrobacter naiadicus TaxID=1392641 RepID=UPI0023618748|nr:MarR family transcriptional regulator [Rubrobacter naiadicus]MCL6437347.1 MarR family transcriptional regulator [Rubrobacteraceae bacterium]
MVLLRDEISATLSYTAAVARRVGLGLSEVAALEHLGAGELTPKELGRRLSMSSGAVTALVDRLERAGFAKRYPNPEDRRSSVIRATPRGVAEARRHLRPLVQEIRAVVEHMDEDERRAVARFLRDVVAAVWRQVD